MRAPTPSKVSVIGQPRFDYYRHPDRWPDDLGYGESGPIALFLSYHVDHHHPSEGQGIPVWATLHQQTEDELWKLARSGWRVLVKPHPQQPWQAERRRIRREVGDLLGRSVHLVDPMADARKLIAGCDVLVGFQSTAMIEAMLARKPVVYTGWDEESQGISSQLIPFAEWDDLVHVVRDRAQMVPMIEAARGRAYDAAEAARADEIVERYLGRIDGDASERTIAVLRNLVTTCAGAQHAGDRAPPRAARRAPARAPSDPRRAHRRAPAAPARRRDSGPLTAPQPARPARVTLVL